MTDLDLAYTAGIIDGEGCIYIRVSDRPIPNKIRTTFYGLVVEVKNTDSRMIDFLYERYNGLRKIERRETERGKKVYCWVITGKRAVVFLESIYPFLVCKKDQVDIAVRFRKTFGKSYNNTGTPPDVLKIRIECYNELKRLHSVLSHKGDWAKV